LIRRMRFRRSMIQGRVEVGKGRAGERRRMFALYTLCALRRERKGASCGVLPYNQTAAGRQSAGSSGSGWWDKCREEIASGAGAVLD
jgi:hypothetical protein